MPRWYGGYGQCTCDESFGSCSYHERIYELRDERDARAEAQKTRRAKKLAAQALEPVRPRCSLCHLYIPGANETCPHSDCRNTKPRVWECDQPCWKVVIPPPVDDTYGFIVDPEYRKKIENWRYR